MCSEGTIEISGNPQLRRGVLHLLVWEMCILKDRNPKVCRSVGGAEEFLLEWLQGHGQCPRLVWVVVLMSSYKRLLSPSR